MLQKIMSLVLLTLGIQLVGFSYHVQDEVKNSNRIGIHAVSDIASDLTPAYLEAHGFKSVPKSIKYGYIASGYGFVQDMPYAYLHEFTRTSMAGKIRRMKEAEIGLLDVSDLESELFSKVQTIDYYTIVLEIKGLERIPVGFYYLGEYMNDPSTIGHPVAMQRFYADTNIFLFWYYGDSVNIRGSNVIDLAIEVVKRMGGEVEKVVLQRCFKYFPHVGSKDMKDGFYERVESELQGHRNTHYVGGLFAFELTERNSSYAMAQICKHFASANSLPTFPYVKEAMAPGYGLAENCVFVSCAYGKRKSILVDWQGRICCGYVDPNDADVDIRIVDADVGLEVDEDGKEGEIWISSPSAGIRYWGKEELSEKTFRNKLRKYPGRKYTRTGDLGWVIQGNLFITGRIKDLIIVAGRNIYSADVEKTVESSSELLQPGCCAVIGVPEDVLSAKGISLPDASDQVGLVVVAELTDSKPVDKDITKQIESHVVEEHGVTVASVKLIRPRTISKATSGKIKRFECLKQFVDGTLNTVPDPIVTKRSLIRSFTTGTCREGNAPRPHVARGSPPPST
ncbi:uncharacterized protein J3R85_011981, partial [Psidium guajava]